MDRLEVASRHSSLSQELPSTPTKSPRKEGSWKNLFHREQQSSQSQITNSTSSDSGGSTDFDETIDAIVASRERNLVVGSISTKGTPNLQKSNTNKWLLKLFGKGANEKDVLITHSTCIDALNRLVAMSTNKDKELVDVKDRLAKAEEDLIMEKRRGVMAELELRDLEDLVEWQRQELDEIRPLSSDVTETNITDEVEEEENDEDTDSQMVDVSELVGLEESPNTDSDAAKEDEGDSSWARGTAVGLNLHRSASGLGRAWNGSEEEQTPAKTFSFGSEMKELKRELEQMKLAHQRAVTAWNDAESQNRVLQERLGVVEENGRRLMKENGRLRSAMDVRKGDDLIDKLTAAEASVQLLVAENERLRPGAVDSDGTGLQRMALLEKFTAAEERAIKLSVENRRLQIELEESRRVESDLQSNLEEMEVTVKKLVGENRHLRMEMESARVESDKRVAVLVEERNGLLVDVGSWKVKQEALQAEVLNHRDDMERLLKEKEAKETELVKLRIQVTELMRELATQSEILNKKSAELQFTQEKEKIAKHESVVAHSQAAMAMGENEKLGLKLSGLLESIGRISTAVSGGPSNEAYVQLVSEDREALRENILDITEQIIAMQQQLGEKQKANVRMEERNRKLILRSSKLEEEVEELSIELQNVESFLAHIADVTKHISGASIVDKKCLTAMQADCKLAVSEVMVKHKYQIFENCLSLRRRLSESSDIDGTVLAHLSPDITNVKSPEIFFQVMRHKS